jgi:hypothetical protein
VPLSSPTFDDVLPPHATTAIAASPKIEDTLMFPREEN